MKSFFTSRDHFFQRASGKNRLRHLLKRTWDNLFRQWHPIRHWRFSGDSDTLRLEEKKDTTRYSLPTTDYFRRGAYHSFGGTPADNFELLDHPTEHGTHPFRGRRLFLRAGQLSLLLLAVCLVFLGCQNTGTPPLLPVNVTPTVAVQGTQTPPNGEGSGVITTGDHQLVIWAPDFFQPPIEAAAVPVLEDVYEQFRRNHPGVHLDIQTKAEDGESGLFTYLRYAQSMAPTILPDMILLDSEQLWQAAELGLLQPIAWENLPRTTDFFQFAREAVHYQGQTLGIPYTADVIHLVYHADQLQQAPTTWETLVGMGKPYFFAAGKQEQPNESLLLQYVGAGGQLFEDGSVSSPDAIVALLTFLAQAKVTGILPGNILEIDNVEAAWSAFETNNTGVADTSARQVLAKRNTLDNLGFAQIPTTNGAAVTIARTWAFALITSDVEQQQLALDLVEQLLDPAVHGAWSRTSRQLPTQVTAYATWSDTSPYYEFLQRQLDVAIAIPNGRRFAEFAKRLQQAQELVLLNQMNIEDAAQFVQALP